MSLSSTVKSLQDTMRMDAGIDGDAQRIGQLAWLLFYKIYSDLELETELHDSHYKSPILARLRWDAWANQSLLGKDAPTGDALLHLVNDNLFPTFKALDLSQFSGKTRSRAALLRGVFEDAFNYMKSGALLRQVINKIDQDIDFNQGSTRHLFGEVYEQILKDLQSAGNAGEFYTPRAVTKFAVEMVAPRLGERVMDLACGTGGFLTAAYDHLRLQASSPEELELAKRSIFGVEKKALPHLLGVTNLMVHGIEDPSNLQHGNTLSRRISDYSSDDLMDVILINPPYGGTEEEAIKRNFPAEYRSSETAVLFIVLVLELLAEGGRAAVVLSDGFLFGEDNIQTRIKRRLIAEFNLHTVVRLPSKVFAPYTDIKTNILFFDKTQPTKEVWFYEQPYPPGQKSYSKTQPMRLDELDAVGDWWSDRRENSQAWCVPVEDIVAAGYNLDMSNPNAPVAERLDPSVWLDRLEHAEKSVEVAFKRLQASLTESLASTATEESI